jgi:hypothetical protein
MMLIISIFSIYYKDDESTESEMGKRCGMHWREEKLVQNFG